MCRLGATTVVIWLWVHGGVFPAEAGRGNRVYVMLCRQQWIAMVLLCVCVLAAPADAQSRRERAVARDLTAGAAAYEDGMYSAAQRFFEDALKRANDPDQIREATLWLVRALYRRSRHEAVLDILDTDRLEEAEPALRQVYRFWRARSQYARGSYEQVIEELNAVEPAVLEDAEAAQRLRMFGRSYARTQRHESALRVFEMFDRNYPEDPEAPDNLLDWAGSLIDLDRLGEAEALLRRLIEAFDTTRASQTARLWLGVMLVDRDDLEEAREVLDALIERETLPSDWAAEAWYAVARIEEVGGDFELALDALVTGQEGTREQAVVNRGRLLRARVLFRMGAWEEGIVLLERVISAIPGHEVSAQAQLELAGALLEQERYSDALEAYQHYLEAFEDDEGRANALLGRAWTLLGMRRPIEAASSFEKAYALHPGLMERQQALFKVADSYFQSRQFARAREEYLLMTKVFPGSDLIPLALFQAAECLARQRKVEEAISEFRAIEDAFPASQYAEQSAMRIGGLNEEISEWERAITAYNRLMQGYPGGPMYADALHRRGLIRYRLGLFQEALADFERVVEKFPQAASAEQAFYMRGWCLYLLGENEAALTVSDAFIQRFPHSTWTPDVLFWLASYHYNQGLFVEAERRFLEVTDAHPDGALGDISLYWAGRAAMEQEEYLKAIDHFNRLAKEYPNSAKMPEVRFAQGDTLSQLGEFSGAILAFEEVIRRYPDRRLAVLAWGRKGDCHFTLGNEDPARYDEAMVAYQAVLDSPTASNGAKLQAEYKIGRCHEKTGDAAEALARYLQVVYEYVHNRDARGPEATIWFTRAAFTAASMREAEGDRASAINLLERVVEANVPAAPDAERRIQKIRGDLGAVPAA